MRYLSLFSGIEAASVAWHGLGWSPVAFTEIEPFPAAVLKERFPTVPNWGDVTKFKEWPDVCLCNSAAIHKSGVGSYVSGIGNQRGDLLHLGSNDNDSRSSLSDARPSDSVQRQEGNKSRWEGERFGHRLNDRSDVHADFSRQTLSSDNLCKQCGGLNGAIDLIVGGSPCQSFSVAGLRKGMDDPRGNLALTHLAIVDKYRPEWVVWENVPGVLSSNGGRDFGSFLGALDEIGYGYAWRVLDAQYVRTPDYPRAVPQRRRRVFVVGNLRHWSRAAAVLFDSESLSGNPPPSRTKRQGITANASDGIGTGGRGVEPYQQIVGTDCADDAKWVQNQTVSQDKLIVQEPICYENHANDSRIKELKDNTSPTVSSRWGTGGNNQALVQAVAFEPGSVARNAGPSGEDEVCPTLRSNMGDNQPAVRIEEEMTAEIYQASELRLQGKLTPKDICPTLKADTKQGDTEPFVHSMMFKVRGGSEVELGTHGSTNIGKAAGKGYLGSEESAFTVASVQDQWLAQEQTLAIDSLNLTANDEVSQTVKSPSGGTLESVGGVLQSNVVAPSLTASNDPSRSPQSSEVTQQVSAVYQSTMAVRRLTPVECERLQGFPDDWTRIPWRKKSADDCPDGSRYKAIGNSMAVNVMQWIGLRIQMLRDVEGEIERILAEGD